MSMDQTMADLGTGTAYNGDAVVLVGEQDGQRIRIEDLARQAGTVPHEILTSINTRVSRVYSSSVPRSTRLASSV